MPTKKTVPSNITFPAGGGTVAVTTDIELSPTYITASDTLNISADTERSTASSTYTKLKEITIWFPGTIRIKYDLKRAFSTVYGRVYVNDLAVGGELYPDAVGSYETESVSSLQVSPGDKVSLYCKASGGDTCYTRYFRIYFDKTSLTADGTVITD